MATLMVHPSTADVMSSFDVLSFLMLSMTLKAHPEFRQKGPRLARVLGPYAKIMVPFAIASSMFVMGTSMKVFETKRLPSGTRSIEMPAGVDVM